MTSIYAARARVTDAAALARFLTPIPNPEQVRSLLGTKFFGRIYDQERRSDYWIGSDDGEIVCCVTLQGVSSLLAAKVRLMFDEIESPTMSVELLKQLVTQAAPGVEWSTVQ